MNLRVAIRNWLLRPSAAERALNSLAVDRKAQFEEAVRASFEASPITYAEAAQRELVAKAAVARAEADRCGDSLQAQALRLKATLCDLRATGVASGDKVAFVDFGPMTDAEVAFVIGGREPS